MTAALARAVKRHKWIVVTGWSPHWMWGRFKLRYLADPKNALGQSQHVDTIVGKGFYAKHPKVYEMLARMYFRLEDINKMLSKANDTSYEKAAKAYIGAHPDDVNYWLTGKRAGQ